MEQITHHKFSLFRTENIENKEHPTFRITTSYFEFIGTFDSLEKAKSAQKEYKESTIILPSY